MAFRGVLYISKADESPNCEASGPSFGAERAGVILIIEGFRGRRNIWLFSWPYFLSSL